MSIAEQHERLTWKNVAQQSAAKPGNAFSSPKKTNKPRSLVIPDNLLGWIIPISVLVLWEVFARAGMLPPNWLPAPTVIAQTIYQLDVAGDLWRHVGITLGRVTLGFLLGATAGTILGGIT